MKPFPSVRHLVSQLAMPALRIIGALGLASTLLLSGCSNMDSRDRSTVGGAAIGGVAGALLTNGSALGTVGGAAVGGVVGNQIRR